MACISIHLYFVIISAQLFLQFPNQFIYEDCDHLKLECWFFSWYLVFVLCFCLCLFKMEMHSKQAKSKEADIKS